MTDKIFGSPSKLYWDQNRFTNSEVGINHPKNPGFIRICDNGNIEIVAGDEVSIILNPASKTILFNADTIKFVTKDEGGLRWNQVAFNSHATGFSEPTLVTMEDDLDIKSPYRGVDYFLEGISPPEMLMVTDPATGRSISMDQYLDRLAASKSSNTGSETSKDRVLNPNNLRDI